MKKNNWRSVLPLEDNAGKVQDSLDDISRKLQRLCLNTSKSKDLEVHTTVDVQFPTLDDLQYSNDHSQDSALRWATQNSLQSVFINSVSSSDVYFGIFKIFDVVPVTRDGIEITPESFDEETQFYLYPRNQIGKTLLEDIMQVLDPSEFIIKIPRRFFNDGKAYVCKDIDFNTMTYFLFTWADFDAYIQLISRWGRPSTFDGIGYNNVVSPYNTLTLKYKRFQVEEHNWTVARMHSREYLKQVLYKYCFQIPSQTTQAERKNNDQFHCWAHRFTSSLIREYGIGTYTHQTLEAAVLDLITSEEWLHNMFNSKYYDSFAVNLDETPQKAFYDLVVYELYTSFF